MGSVSWIATYACGMIDPAPTTKIDPTLARGKLTERLPATATKPERVRLAFPNTSYDLHLVVDGGIDAADGKRVIGKILADARRVDVVRTGGKFIEPVYGPLQRVQGRVVASDPGANAIVVNAGVPVHLRLTDHRQRAEQFERGDLVAADVLEGARFRVEG